MRDIYTMNKKLFLQHQREIVDQLKMNAIAIEDITYVELLKASEQAEADGHEQPDVVAFIGLFSDLSTIDLQFIDID